jgi:hypothetical protein
MNLKTEISRIKGLMTEGENQLYKDKESKSKNKIKEEETDDMDVSDVESGYNFDSGGPEQFEEPVDFSLDSLLGIKPAYNFDSDGGDVDVYGEEMAEQEDGGGDTTGDSDATNAGISTWDSGVSRGPANPIDQNSKWQDSYGITRGKGNPLW